MLHWQRPLQDNRLRHNELKDSSPPDAEVDPDEV